MKISAWFVSAILLAVAPAPLVVRAADAPVGKTGPQVDGHFRKVVLDEDEIVGDK